MIKINFKKGYILILTLVVIIICSVSANIVQAVNAANPEPGSDGDPLVSKSYVDTNIQKYIQQLQNQINDLKGQAAGGNSGGFKVITVEAGKDLYLGNGSEIVLRSGTAKAIKGQSGGLSDTTSAKDLVNGMSVAANHLIISASDDGRGIHAVTKCYVLVRGAYRSEQTSSVNSGSTAADTTNTSDSNNSSSIGNTSSTDNTSTQTQTASTGTVNVKSLNIRERPDVTANLLGTAPMGEILTILSSSGGWYQITTPDGLTGWVFGSYVTIN